MISCLQGYENLSPLSTGTPRFITQKKHLTINLSHNEALRTFAAPIKGFNTLTWPDVVVPDAGVLGGYFLHLVPAL
jgi:hypothetical protein